MPLYLWISTRPGQYARNTKGEDIKGTRNIKDVLPCWKNKEAHKSTNLLTDPLPQEEHVSNVGKWVISLGTAQRRENRRTSISSTVRTTTLSLLYPSFQ